jgi:hypothetical protein
MITLGKVLIIAGTSLLAVVVSKFYRQSVRPKRPNLRRVK